MTLTEPMLSTGEFVARAQAALPGLGETDRRVIETILHAPEEVVRGSVTELAQRAGVAQSSAVRACQRIGYRGYQDVKIAITRDLAYRSQQKDEIVHEEGIDAQTPAAEVISRILRRSGRALVEATQTVDPDAFAEVVDRITRAKRILVIGNGTSTAPAQDAAYRLTALGFIVNAPTDVMTQHLLGLQLDASSVCLVISHTGSSRESLNAAQAASNNGAYVAAITSFSNSPLTKIADTSLIAGGPDSGFRLEVMASRLAHLGVIDALFVGIAVRRPTESNAALDVMADLTVQHSL